MSSVNNHNIPGKWCLAMLAAVLKPESGDAHAMVGVYPESAGQVGEADACYGKAGESSRAKFEKLFSGAPSAP